jgi:hypothetical protein
MSDRRHKGLSRRAFLKSAAIAGGALAVPGSIASMAARAQSASGCDSGAPHRFLEIALSGGWDSLLATDPVVGSKRGNAAFQSDYQGYENTTVPGKDKLVMGHGLAPAASAFEALPTCFVNGMLVEVTAHELAFNYLLSGRMSLSRTRDFPSAAALAGVAGDCFPAHVLLGDPIPLGDSDLTHPPLHASSLSSLIQMLSGPRSGDDPLNETGVAKAHDVIAKLNAMHVERQGEAARTALAPWLNAELSLAGLYGQRYDLQFALNDEDQARYIIEDGYGPESNMLAALMVLRSGLSPFVTVNTGGYDTHANHLSGHIPLMQGFASRLATLVADMQVTPDPSDSSLMLSDTTTILITSEFTRTPLFNIADGTDHWPTASAIVMGKGVADNAVIGATGDDAYALGWSNGQPRTFDKATNALMPEHVIASVLDILGVPEDTINALTTVRLDELRA